MCRYHSISEHLLDIDTLTRMLPLHDVALDDVERPWRCAKHCHKLMPNHSYTTKIHYLKLQTSANGTKYLLLDLYSKRVIALIPVNIILRWDIYGRELATRPSISQLNTIFTDISAITLSVAQCGYEKYQCLLTNFRHKNTKSCITRFPIPYHYPSLRQFLDFAVTLRNAL